MCNEFGKKPKFTLVTVIALAAVMLVAAATEMAITGYAFAYNRNQAKSDINECGNGSFSENIGCQNIDSQIQGDKNTVALTAQQTFPSQEPPPPPTTATLIVIKEVECVEGEECPGLPEPSEFTLSVVPEGGAAISVGQDPAFGEPIPIPLGDYQVSEDPTPPNVDGLDFVNVSPDNGCDSGMSGGPIRAGEVRTCTFTNFYAPAPPTLIMKKIVECTGGRECPGLPQPDDFLITVTTSNNPQPEPVQGSTEGIPITLTSGEYSTGETRPAVPEGLSFVGTELSTDCSSDANGPILAGQVRECTITNTYARTVGTVIVTVNVVCEPGRVCPSLPGSNAVSVGTFGQGIPASFPGSASGTPVTFLTGNYLLSASSNNPPGGSIVRFIFTGSCASPPPISAGEVRTCSITAEFRPSV
jgi:hypothetical protein